MSLYPTWELDHAVAVEVMGWEVGTWRDGAGSCAPGEDPDDRASKLDGRARYPYVAPGTGENLGVTVFPGDWKGGPARKGSPAAGFGYSWSPATRWEAAGMVLDRLRELGLTVEVWQGRARARVSVLQPPPGELDVAEGTTVEAETVPEALARAALDEIRRTS